MSRTPADHPLVALGPLGQSPWYDFITRDLLESGTLAALIATQGLKGMTSNPTIFEKAIAGTAQYDEEIRTLAAAGRDHVEIYETLAVADVQAACDIFRPVFDEAKNGDGTVSLEVSPELAHDGAGTFHEAQRLWAAVNRPNLMVKIPGTVECLGAISDCLAAGISVNVTLLFSAARYAQVVEAFLTGLERRTAAGQPLAGVYSVASFFVSRVDSSIDALIDKTPAAASLRGTIAIANAAAAYELFTRSVASARWQALAARGATPQRPLWASTGTKDPKYSDVYYVEALIAPDTVNTLPPATFNAFADHGTAAVRLPEAVATAPARLALLAAAGIDLGAVTTTLEVDGVASFAASFRAMLDGIASKATALAAH